MIKRFYWIVLVFCLACGKDELPPRETTLLENWEIKETISPWLFNFSDKTQFVNEWVGFRTGPFLYKTTDGGRNFTGIFEMPYSPNPPAFFALDEQQLWLTSTRLEEDNKSPQGIVYRSKDGGETWEVFERKNTFFERISFSSPTRGFAYAVEYTGSLNDQFQLFETIDGGETWNPTSVDFSRVNLIQFLWKTEDLGFIIGLDGAHYRTIDGGETWTPFRSNPSGGESFFYPVDADRYYEMRLTETIQGNWANRTETRLDQPIYILSQTGQDVIGFLLDEGCLPYTPCKNWLMSSKDGGVTWEKHLGISFDNILRREQEIRSGLVFISDRNSANMIQIMKK
ncbi:hypothetical protein [Algoriphagus sp. CAU 1675]|uniref:WD40/YVTN/BNR-like repeat-containing protein n=1 Tax=Algoriphagus sp. CAU 1675 TaxID=3032597 RepID=UPI0023DCE535|nr:hypothetical protein [Algoriphagus sp. CAU 1675]MDF2157217.1 hypothetical protein [Algoriphagus sp. CAU 1675]